MATIGRDTAFMISSDIDVSDTDRLVKSENSIAIYRLTLFSLEKNWQLLAIRQQAITWGNVYPDLCRHMASLAHSGQIHLHLD